MIYINTTILSGVVFDCCLKRNYHIYHVKTKIMFDCMHMNWILLAKEITKMAYIAYVVWYCGTAQSLVLCCFSVRKLLNLAKKWNLKIVCFYCFTLLLLLFFFLSQYQNIRTDT